jgi:NitT/TauT family transport system ATP-binding protein
MKLQVNHIRKTFHQQFGDIDAIADLSLGVRKGEFVCLVGPSGCGKSTLLSIIAGLEKGTAGTIQSSGKIGMLFQDPTLFPWLTVWENIAFGLRMRNVRAQDIPTQVIRMIRLVKLHGFEQAYPHQLSGGMKQRTAIARTLVLSPDILLMDEPFASLDALTRETLYGDLQRICKITGATVLFVTHNVREAACLGDRILVMSPRPGTITAEVRVRASRPRNIGDTPVIRIANRVRTLLTAN